MRHYWMTIFVILLPFSSEVNPEAASTFSSILRSFITFVAQTYPCLEDKDRASYELADLY